MAVAVSVPAVPEPECVAFRAWANLARAARWIGRQVAPGLAEAGLSELQFDTLCTLFEYGPMVQARLAKRVLCTTGNMTLVLDRLEGRRLVRRERLPRDRRTVTVHLTPEGLALTGEVVAVRAAAIEQQFRVLTPDEQRVLGELCLRLERHATENHETGEGAD